MDAILGYAQQVNSNGGSGGSGLMWIIGAVGLWKMFEMAGVEGWAGLIPFYREYKLCEITMGNPWYWLRELWFFVPVIGWALGLYYIFQICKATALSYGKPESWAWGYLFLGPIFYCITGFGDTDYYGVMGSGDTRTYEARGARTVDFDVVENRNEPEYTDYSHQTRVDAYQDVKVEEYKEDTVNFTVDEPVE